MRFLLFALLLSFVLCSRAQDDYISHEQDSTAAPERASFWSRTEIGGNLGLQFGSITLVDISPLIGYRITKRLTAGLGFSYMYYNNSFYQVESTVLGGRTYGRFSIIENIFLYSEYEVLNGDWSFDGKRFNIESFFVGGGFAQRLGGNSFFTLMILWNLNDSYLSPYSNPVLRGGFAFGL